MNVITFFGKLLSKGLKMTKDGTQIKQPQSERAIFHFKQAIKTNPKSYKSYYELGILLSKEEQFIEAFECLQKSIEINPEFADGHYQLAVLLMNQSAQAILNKNGKRKRLKQPSSSPKAGK